MRQAVARARAWWSESRAEIPKALSPAVRRGGEGGVRGLAKVRTSRHRADLLTPTLSSTQTCYRSHTSSSIKSRSYVRARELDKKRVQWDGGEARNPRGFSTSDVRMNLRK